MSERLFSRARPVPNLLLASLMALFSKDTTQGVMPDGIAQKETRMADRDTTMAAPGGMDAFLGKGTKITGKLVFDGKGRIEGHVEGEITAQDTLIIGESAVVNAKITGNAIIIEGRVTGDVSARQRLELRAPSRVQGNITTASLVVHEGAVFEGQCSMKGADGKSLDVKRDATATAPVTLGPRRETPGQAVSA